MGIYVAPRRAEKAGPVGPGSGVLQTEFTLGAAGGSLGFFANTNPQKKMAKAWQLGIEVPWIRAAERVISGRVQSLGWHLEDENGETVDDETTDRNAQEARLLIEKPQAALGIRSIMFRSDLWRLTMRHVGLCGNAFWYLDSPNAYGIPKGILYIRPDRMTPVEDDAGNLTGWLIDKTATNPGIGVKVEEIIHFVLDPPDVGHFGSGLVESALMKAQNSIGLDKHLAMLISSGGRLSGFLSPKAGAMAPEQMSVIERDWRTVVEQSDAAKRLQILAAPVDFTKTMLSPAEITLRDLMTESRDDLLGLWGVPLSKLGIHDRGRGLSGSSVTEKDDETLWTDAVIPRTASFGENIQYRLLDPYAALGTTLTFVLETPEFDDDAPRFDAAQKSVSLPLTVNQRLEILGLDPLSDDVVGPSGGPLGYEIILPATSVYYANAAPGFKAPGPAAPVAEPVPQAPTETTASSNAAGETSDGSGVVKATVRLQVPAITTTLRNLRSNVARHAVPRIKSAVSGVLADQRVEIAAKIRRHAALIARRPADATVWFDARKWDAKLTEAIRPHAMTAAESVAATVEQVLPSQKAALAVSGPVDRVLTRTAARVTGINATTRTKVAAIIERAVEAGIPLGDVADAIEGIDAETVIEGLDAGSLFDDYRAELIARTELMDAYNAATIAAYSDAGISFVQAIDGTGDEECAARDGQVVPIDEAETTEDHPNGTLDWVPVIPDAADLADAGF